MSEKRVLKPKRLVATQSLAASFNSTPTMIPYLDNIAYQITVTTSNSTGTFSVQGSLDYVAGTDPMAAPAVAGHWTDLTLSGTPTVAAANDTISIGLTQVPYVALRLAYTSTIAGTGTCEIWVSGKGLS